MSTNPQASNRDIPADGAAPTRVLTPSEHNLIWIDLEMTGLDPDQDRIIEIAVVVTDPQVTLRVEGPVIAVHQAEDALARMDNWNRSTHGKSGLTQRVRESTVTEAEAQTRVLDFLRHHVPKGKSPMCGNSVCQDRRFLVRGMPALEAWFHYRNLDVSTLKELARRWAPKVLEGFKKAQKHTALADIHESIDELLHYRAHLLK
jgi:oligoribonuclease